MAPSRNGIRSRTSVAAAVLLHLPLLAAACRGPGAPAPRPVEHLVLVWLAEPGNGAHVERITAASRDLAEIPGVLAVRAGRPLPSERPVVESSYDVALLFTFESAEALERYLVDPRHERASRDVLAPLAQRVLVVDFACEERAP